MPHQHTIDAAARDEKERALAAEKLHQAGIGFPSASRQKHLLVVRLDLALPPAATSGAARIAAARDGLRRLCGLLSRLDSGEKTIDVLGSGGLVTRPLADFHFSATLGFGAGFFDALEIPASRRPGQIRAMPTAAALGDPSPYSLGQSDLLLQLGSSDDFVNRWVLENSPPPPPRDPPVPEDIVSAIAGWATITDVHAGFQRVDGRNLQGFNDGVSNPRRLSPLFDRVVWSTSDEEPAALVGGTYLVFQKIVHDLDQWKSLDPDEQEEWIGRKKSTGLLLGSLSDGDHQRLERQIHDPDPAVRAAARAEWKRLFDLQSDPQTPFFDHDPDGAPLYGSMPDRCPAWAHVRKSNPRAEDGRLPEQLIFRRGYPFLESGPDDRVRSGLLFVCFQRDLAAGFERVKRMQNGGDRPVPTVRPFTPRELDGRHRRGRFSAAELGALTLEQRALLGIGDPSVFAAALAEAGEDKAQQTGREGLAGPSENGVTTSGELLGIVPLGGGYYFVPPIPGRDVGEIGQQFFA